MIGARVHHNKENWDGEIVNYKGGPEVQVQSDGGYLGWHSIKSFSILTDPTPINFKFINRPIDLLERLKDHVFDYQPGAVKSLRAAHHMNDVPEDLEIDPRIVDAVLIDFLNFVGACYGVDYAIYTKDLPAPGLLEKMARAAAADEPIDANIDADLKAAGQVCGSETCGLRYPQMREESVKKIKTKKAPRGHMPPITPEARKEALERGARERDALNRKGKPHGY